jgi:hypothetical protein
MTEKPEAEEPRRFRAALIAALADSIKSLEGFRIAWIEEPQSLSDQRFRCAGGGLMIAWKTPKAMMTSIPPVTSQIQRAL